MLLDKHQTSDLSSETLNCVLLQRTWTINDVTAHFLDTVTQHETLDSAGKTRPF